MEMLNVTLILLCSDQIPLTCHGSLCPNAAMPVIDALTEMQSSKFSTLALIHLSTRLNVATGSTDRQTL